MRQSSRPTQHIMEGTHDSSASHRCSLTTLTAVASQSKIVFPAGEYVFTLDTISTGSVTIRSSGNQKRTILLARKVVLSREEGIPTVGFNSYGESRFLSKLQNGQTNGWEVAPSPMETQISRNMGGPPRVTALRATSRESE